MKRILILLAAVLITATGFSQSVGSTAPGFTLDKLGGGNGSLSNYEGKVVMVFLFGHNCPYCIGAASAIKSDIINEFKSNPNFIAIGIEVWDGSVSEVQSFKNSTGFDFPLFLKGSSVASNWSSSYDRLLVIGADGKFVYKGNQRASGNITQTKSAVQEALSNVSTALQKPERNILKQNYPNPFSESTTITFDLEKRALVQIDILDITGKRIVELVSGSYPAGNQSVIFNRDGLKSGLYFYRITADNKVDSKLMQIK